MKIKELIKNQDIHQLDEELNKCIMSGKTGDIVKFIANSINNILKNYQQQYNWEEKDLLKVIRLPFENFKQPDLIRIITLSLCINLSKKRKFVFKKKMEKELKEKFSFYFLIGIKNKEVVIKNWKKLPSSMCPFMNNCELIIKGTTTEIRLGEGIKKSRITIENCKGVYLHDLENTEISIDNCENIIIRDFTKGKINIKRCGQISEDDASKRRVKIWELLDVKEIDSSTINIQKYMIGKEFLPLQITSNYFTGRGDLSTRETSINNIKNSQNIYLKTIKEVYEFFKDHIHPIFGNVKEVPPLYVKFQQENVQGFYEPVKKTITLLTLDPKIIKQVIVHEYIHYLLHKALKQSYFFNPNKILPDIDFNHSEISYLNKLKKILRKEDKIVSRNDIYEAVTDFLTMYYCISNDMDFDEGIGYTSRERIEKMFLQKINYKNFNKDLKILQKKSKEKEFWINFFKNNFGIKLPS